MKVIYDTDIGWMNDDAIAAIMALESKQIELLGITPIMGNFDLDFEVAAALRLVELIGHPDVPVCAGFDRPLVHTRDAYADQVWGKWATFEKDFQVPGGMPQKPVDQRHASDFIIEQVTKFPGEVTLIAVGPLTNVAAALRKAPWIAGQFRQVIVMGGAIALFPGGWGNHTPVSEFNVWVDPEAAKIVLNAGLPLTLLPLNVCRQTFLPRPMVARIASSSTVNPAVARLFGEYVLPRFGSAKLETDLSFGFYDSTAIAFALRPDIFKSKRLSVEVVTEPGMLYGMTYAFEVGPMTHDDENISFPLPGAPPAVDVVYRVDLDSMAELYLETIGA